MIAHDAKGRRQPEARAAVHVLGREERVEGLLLGRCIHAHTIVRHADAQIGAGIGLSGHVRLPEHAMNGFDLDAGRVLAVEVEGVAGIYAQIQKNLLQLHGVA